MSENNISVERDFVGTLHIKVGDFDYVQIQYQHPFTDNASTRALADRIVAFLAQPAEAEGVEVPVVAYQSRETGEFYEQSYGLDRPLELVLRSDHLAALSAVTAEVEGLRKDADRWRYVRLQGDDTHWLNLLRVDLEDFGGNINAAVDALIDGEAPAMAAKEAGAEEHVCSGCGAKGWTGNCLECIPY